MKDFAMVVIVTASTVGCGAQNGTTIGSGPDAAANTLTAAIDGGASTYFPLAPGLAWTYKVTTVSGTISQHQTTVEATEPSPSTQQPALRVRYELPDAIKLEWDQQVGASVVRYEEHQIDSSGNTVAGKTYSPSELVLDESPQHLVTGAAWSEQFMETKTPSKHNKSTAETAQWTVEAVDEMVTVPAGTFSCLKIQRVHTSSKSPVPETTWYAAGIGKVKEIGAGPNNDEMLEL